MPDKYFGVGDNIDATLSAPVLAVDVILPVVSTAEFDTIDLPCLATIEDPQDLGPFERVIVRDTTQSPTPGLIVERGYDGDSAVPWPVESKVILRVMSEHVQDLYDNNIMQIQESCHSVTVPNVVTGQVDSVNIYTDGTLTERIVECDFTYPNATTQLPSSIERRIYKSPGTELWRTETTTFTYLNGTPLIISRTVS